jgi:hypothetical protein
LHEGKVEEGDDVCQLGSKTFVRLDIGKYKERRYPLGLFPRARKNWCMRNARYKTLTTLLKMGVASFPNGQPLFLFVALGVPTMSMMTEVVSQ